MTAPLKNALDYLSDEWFREELSGLSCLAAVAARSCACSSS